MHKHLSKEVNDSPLKMYELAQTNLGKTIIAELKKISASQEVAGATHIEVIAKQQKL